MPIADHRTGCRVAGRTSVADNASNSVIGRSASPRGIGRSRRSTKSGCDSAERRGGTHHSRPGRSGCGSEPMTSCAVVLWCSRTRRAKRSRNGWNGTEAGVRRFNRKQRNSDGSDRSVYRPSDSRSWDRCSAIHCPLMVPMSRSWWRPSRLIQAHTPTASARTDPTAIAITPDIRHRDRLTRNAQIHTHN